MSCWILESNRWKHLIGGFVLGLTLTVLCALGCAGGMEFKDVHHYNGDHIPMKYWEWSAWDWLDVAAGMIGGVIGQALQILFVYLTFFNR